MQKIFEEILENLNKERKSFGIGIANGNEYIKADDAIKIVERAMRRMKDETHFTDTEYRILLKALGRERKVCEMVDRDCGDHKLIHIMNSIETKIKRIQYRNFI